MKKLIAAVITAISLVGAAPVAASSISEINQASFELYRDNRPICSGQFISPTEFLTAGHCLEGFNDHKYSVVVDKEGIHTSYDLKVNKVYPDYDTATLNLVAKSVNMPFVEIAETYPALGEDILIAGFPGVQGYFIASKGTFENVVPMPVAFMQPNGKDQYVIYVYAIPGSSGSGVYRKDGDDYKLIGTIHGGPTDFINFTSTLEGVNIAR